jgi:F-box and WD-40 domain protein CDC4
MTVLQRQLDGHQGGVWALAARDELLVTGSTDRTLILWNWETGERLADLIGHSSTVRCVLILPGRRLIVSGSRDGTVRVWLPPSGHCVSILTGHSASVRCLADAGDDRHVISGSYDGTIRVWDVLEGKLAFAVGGSHDGKVYSLAATRQFIFSGGMDAKIRVWSAKTGAPIDVFSDHSALVGLLEVRGNHLVAGSTDGSISLWDTRTLRRIKHIELAHRASITALDLNRHVVISGSERGLRLWSIAEMTIAGGGGGGGGGTIGAREAGEGSSTTATVCKGSGGLPEEPVDPISLSDKPEVVWRICMGDRVAIVAYQQAGITRLDHYDFGPQFLE